MILVDLTKYFFRFILSDRRKRYGKTIDGEEIFSSNYQDLAVINLFKRKHGGTYVEIGAQDAVKRSNSYALEINYDWRGLSFEIDREYVRFFNWFRHNTCIEGDATKHDYAEIFNNHALPKIIDYLQIDIDPPEASLAVLKQIPFDQFSFSFITFEHDAYQFGQQTALAQRQILELNGYVPLALDVSQDDKPFEDWWVSQAIFAKLADKADLPLKNQDCHAIAIELARL